MPRLAPALTGPTCPCRAAEWLAAGSVQKLVVVVTGQQTQETLERWVFDVQTDKSVGPEGKVEKSQKEITSEIQAIIRQITASVTFLPLLDEPCTFDLLVYTDNDVDVPQVTRRPRPLPNRESAIYCPRRNPPRTRPPRIPPPLRGAGVGGERPAIHRQLGRGQAALLHHQGSQSRRLRLVRPPPARTRHPPPPRAPSPPYPCYAPFSYATRRSYRSYKADA